MAVKQENFWSYTIYIIAHNETSLNYGSVANTPNMSLGILQWAFSRAVELVQEIHQAHPEYDSIINTTQILSEALSGNPNVWDNRYASSTEKPFLINYLTQEGSKVVQYQKALTDVRGYVTSIEASYTLNDEKTLMYACDLKNQYGNATFKRMMDQTNPDTTLQELFDISMNDEVAGRYKTRHRFTLAACEAYTNQIPSEFPPPPGVDLPSDWVTDDENPSVPAESSNAYGYIVQKGNNLYVYTGTMNGNCYYRSNNNTWLAQTKESSPETPEIPDPPPPTPTVPPNVQTLLDWLYSKIGTNYVYGMSGEVMSSTRYWELRNMYGASLVWPSDIEKVGTVCCDCSGLFYWFLRENGFPNPQRLNSTALRDTATARIPVSQITEANIGWGLWLSGHVGFYIGGNQYLAEDGSAYGCRIMPMSNQRWVTAFKWRDLNYGD